MLHPEDAHLEGWRRVVRFSTVHAFKQKLAASMTAHQESSRTSARDTCRQSNRTLGGLAFWRRKLQNAMHTAAGMCLCVCTDTN